MTRIYYTLDDTAYLMHHGIKGQKWGVRRYRNPDGSLTNAGKKRYGTAENLDRARAKKRKAGRAAATAGAVAVGTAGAVKGLGAIGKGIKKDPEKKKMVNAYFTPSIKAGKDKPQMSPAVRIGKETSKSLEEVTKGIDTYSRIRDRYSVSDDLSGMSDADLKRVINRANLERQYRDIVSQNQSTHRGLDTANDILKITGNVLAVGVSALTVYETINKVRNL